MKNADLLINKVKTQLEVYNRNEQTAVETVNKLTSILFEVDDCERCVYCSSFPNCGSRCQDGRVAWLNSEVKE